MTPESPWIVESVFDKDTLVRGAPARIRCIRIAGQTYSIEGGLARIVRLEDEWYEDVADPARAIEALASARDVAADLLTFWQRIPETEPRFTFHTTKQEEALFSDACFSKGCLRCPVARCCAPMRPIGDQGGAIFSLSNGSP